MELRSFLAEFLNEKGMSLGAEDESSFSMRLLHFRRTFVEKMFAIHGKVEMLKRDQRPLGSYARHYYDLFQLARQQEVLQMLRCEEYSAIKADYDKISREHFERSYFYPDKMSFANSDGCFRQWICQQRSKPSTTLNAECCAMDRTRPGRNYWINS